MKKYIIIILILFWTITAESQILSVSEGASLHVPETITVILSDGIDFNINSESSTFNGNMKFLGSEEQFISGDMPLVLSKLYIENSALFLDNNLLVESELDMQDGIFNIQSNILTLGSDIILNGNFSENCMIVADAVGTFQRNISDNGIYIFPIGDMSGDIEYSPAEISIIDADYSEAYISVSVINNKHPQNVSVNSYLKRYWQVSANGISNQEYDIVLDYVNEDIVGTETEIYGALYSEEWILLNPISNNQITGTVYNFGDFTGGESSAFVGIENIDNNEFNIIGLDDGFEIYNKTGIEIIKISVYNVIGQEIFKQNKIYSNVIEFNAPVNTGIYFIRIETDKTIFSKKVFIY